MLECGGGVKESVNSQYDPLNVWVVSCCCQIGIEVLILFASKGVGVLGGEVDHVDLTVVEGKP